MLKLVVVLSLVAAAFAAVARYPPQEKPPQFADQEGCYIKNADFEKVLPYDQPYYDGKCQKYLCQSSNNETLLESCGAVAIRPGCRKSEDDLTKNYPDCCGTEVCDVTTVAPTTTTSTPSPSTQAPPTPSPIYQAQPAYASAFAQSGGGQPPVTNTYTSGPGAAATATAS